VGVGVSGRLYVLLVEMGCFEFWSFYTDIDVMRVYVDSGDGHVSSCFAGFFFLGFCEAHWPCSYFLFFVGKFLA
jgi:hypothetical protein